MRVGVDGLNKKILTYEYIYFISVGSGLSLHSGAIVPIIYYNINLSQDSLIPVLLSIWCLVPGTQKAICHIVHIPTWPSYKVDWSGNTDKTMPNMRKPRFKYGYDMLGVDSIFIIYRGTLCGVSHLLTSTNKESHWQWPRCNVQVVYTTLSKRQPKDDDSNYLQATFIEIFVVVFALSG
jgi:hypothetical protein